MLDAGCSMPDARCWMLDAGCRRGQRRHRCPFGDSVIGYWVLIGD